MFKNHIVKIVIKLSEWNHIVKLKDIFYAINKQKMFIRLE